MRAAASTSRVSSATRGAPTPATPLPAATLPHASARRRRSALLPPPAAQPSADKSFDAEDDLDSDLAAELTRLRQPDSWRQLQRHLELAWDIRKSRGKRMECSCCRGSRECECEWCHGTGAMMVGDIFLRSSDGSSHCPVCKGKGYVACSHCRGTGYRATWLQEEKPAGSSQ